MMSGMTHSSDDWFEDEAVLFDEAMERFRALGPVETTGPALPGGAVLVQPPLTFVVATVLETPELGRPKHRVKAMAR